MKFSGPQLQLVIKLVTQEAKRNPSVEVDTLLDHLEKSAEYRARHLLAGHGPANGASVPSDKIKRDLAKIRLAKKRREAARPKLEETSYHPLLRKRP